MDLYTDQVLKILYDIFVALPGVLLAAVVGYYFSQRKYTFEKLYDRKLGYMEIIYSQIIDLEDDLKKYVNTTGSMPHKDFLAKRILEFKTTQDKFFKLRKFFLKKEIVLNPVSVDKIESFINHSIDALSQLHTSNLSLSGGDHKTSYQFWEKALNLIETKLQEAKKALKIDFINAVKKGS